MAYAGTLVTQGNGVGVVVEVSSRTELGKISQMLEDTLSLETPLTAALRRIGGLITQGVCLLSFLILVIGTARTVFTTGQGWLPSLYDTLTFAVALAVAAIPEGLPAVVTIALAIGVRRMATRRAVVKRLPAVETLGSTTVICTDKTGTLTRNEMTVCQVWSPNGGTLSVSGIGYEPKGEFRQGEAVVCPSGEAEELLTAACLCSDAHLICENSTYSITGDPTEGALVVVAEKAQLKVEEIRRHAVRLDVLPFESEHQYMATLHRLEGGGNVVYVKGAPEVVLSRCGRENYEQALRQAATMASTGMRVLAVARKEAGKNTTLTKDHVESGLDLVGLIAMTDPPRPEAQAAIQICRDAGITVKMITGDHLATAQAIGEQLGLCAPSGDDKNRQAVSGAELSIMTDQELMAASARYNVFARVAPEHKLRLVQMLQSQSQVVAMTGDGVNDAPALKQADIGIAMGISGTSVAKEAASIVLSDDNFSTIAAAVEEGRRVYDNLMKSLIFILPTNLGLALILTIAVIVFPFDAETRELLLPMNPAQLLWINLVATVALALPLAFEAKEPDIMKRVPRDPKSPIFPRAILFQTCTVAFTIALASIAGFLLEYSQYETSSSALAKAQTVAVTTLIFCQIVYVLQCRSIKGGWPTIKVSGNPYVFAGIVGLVFLQALFVYAPPLQAIFDTASLFGIEVLSSLGLSTLILGAAVVRRLPNLTS
jgi:magnesium-transporting ATPase (P-type)